MSEFKGYGTEILFRKGKNAKIRSWVYALIGLWAVMVGFTIYREMIPLLGIAAAGFGTAAVMEGRGTGEMSGKYLGVAVFVAGVMECISCWVI